MPSLGGVLGTWALKFLCPCVPDALTMALRPLWFPPAAGAIGSVRVEIFDQSSRSSAFVIGGAFNWIGVFAIGMVFPFIVVSVRLPSRAVPLVPAASCRR